jgi:hypothetical protein
MVESLRERLSFPNLTQAALDADLPIEDVAHLYQGDERLAGYEGYYINILGRRQPELAPRYTFSSIAHENEDINQRR